MEPMNCVVQRTDDGLEVWNGEQFQTVDQATPAAMFGLPPEKWPIGGLGDAYATLIESRVRPLIAASTEPRSRTRTRLTQEEVDAMRTTLGRSVSVKAPTVKEADGLATALSLMHPREALRLTESLPGHDCLLVTSTGARLTSPNWG